MKFDRQTTWGAAPEALFEALTADQLADVVARLALHEALALAAAAARQQALRAWARGHS